MIEFINIVGVFLLVYFFFKELILSKYINKRIKFYLTLHEKLKQARFEEGFKIVSTVTRKKKNITRRKYCRKLSKKRMRALVLERQQEQQLAWKYGGSRSFKEIWSILLASFLTSLQAPFITVQTKKTHLVSKLPSFEKIRSYIPTKKQVSDYFGSFYVNLCDSPWRILGALRNEYSKAVQSRSRMLYIGIKLSLIFIMLLPQIFLLAQGHTVEHAEKHGLNGYDISLLVVFAFVVLGLFCEKQWHHLTTFNKTWTVALGGFIMSMIYLAYLVNHGDPMTFGDAIHHASGPTYELLCFLLLAMWIVEHIARQGGIAWISKKIIERSATERDAFKYIFWAVFILSPWIDNVLALLMGLSITGLIFVKKENRAKYIRIVAALIIASNAGGAFSPTGDPPLLLAWIENLLKIEHMAKWMIVPSVLFAIPMYYYTLRKIPEKEVNIDPSTFTTYANSPKMLFWGIASIALALPLRFTFPMIPPYIALLGSYVIYWTISAVLNRGYNELVAPREAMPEYATEDQVIEYRTLNKVPLKSHLDFLKSSHHIDVELLVFFLGLLTCVATLEVSGTLEYIASGVDTNVHPDWIPATYGSSSSLVDNVAMQMIVIGMYKLKAMGLAFWVKTTFYICVGGCYLLTGTASGVASMERSGIGMWEYIKLTAIPITIGLLLCEFIWFRGVCEHIPFFMFPS